MKTKFVKYILLSALCFLCSINAFAQQTISGVIFDQNDEPVIGATVLLVGTQIGTASDFDGRFILNIPSEAKPEISISFIGFAEQIINVKDKKNIKVVLEEDAVALEDVVVQVGYGIMKKSDLTGSMTSVNIDEKDALKSSSINQLLAGRVAGLNVTSSSSAPGAAVNIEIRGASSINSSSEPLYVIDGVIMGGANEDVGDVFRGDVGANLVQSRQSALSFLNPSDIASMEVLKDASATAIYGSQGANGVIIITTKSGQSSKPSVVLTHNTEVAMPSNKLNTLGYDDYMNYTEKLSNALGYPNPYSDSTQIYHPRDWQNESMQLGVSNITRVSLSKKIKGGGNYYFALGNSDVNGVMKNSYQKMNDVRANISIKPRKNITLNSNNVFSYGRNSMATRVIHSMTRMKPFEREIDPNQVIENDYEIGVNKYIEHTSDVSKEYRVNSSLALQIKIVEGVNWKSSAGIDYRSKVREVYEGPEVQGTFSKYDSRMGNSSLTSLNFNTDHQINYFGKFKKHTLNAMLGITFSGSQRESENIYAENMLPTDWREDGYNFAASTYAPAYSYIASRLMSAYARVNYNYGQRYLLTVTFRADGSSKFAPSNRFGYFPSAAFAWRINQEEFLKDVDWISNFKFRAGWGQVGNQNFAPYQTALLYNAVKAPIWNSDLNAGGTSGSAAQAAAVNDKLVWETTEQLNLGIDFSIFKDRLNATIDVYDKTTKDLLLNMQKPLSTAIGGDGYNIQREWVNQGDIRNRGIEVSVYATPVQVRDFKWMLSANIGVNRNKITKLNIQKGNFGIYKDVEAFLGSNVTGGVFMACPSNIFMTGESLGAFFGLQTEGIVKPEDLDADGYYKYTYKGKKAGLGTRKYVDQNGDGNIDDNDRIILGNPNPKFAGGFSTTFQYKGWSLDAAFKYSYGAQVANVNNLMGYATGDTGATPQYPNVFKNAVDEAYDPVTNPEGTFPMIGMEPSSRSLDFPDYILEDASYLRLDNITLSYMFDMKKVKWINNLSLSLSARNVFCWTNYSGFDPEVSSFSYDPLRRGLDYMSYPNSRGYSASLNITF